MDYYYRNKWLREEKMINLCEERIIFSLYNFSLQDYL